MKKLVIERDELMGVVAKVSGWASDAISITVTNKKVEGFTMVQMAGYDGVMAQVLSSFFVKTEEEPFRLVLEAKLFTAAVNTLAKVGSTFTLVEEDDGSVTLKCGTAKVSLSKKEDMTTMTMPTKSEPAVRVVLPMESFRALILKGGFGGRNIDDTRYNVVSFLIKGQNLFVLSTDGVMFSSGAVEVTSVDSGFPGEMPECFTMNVGKAADLLSKLAGDMVTLIFYENKTIANSGNDICVVLSNGKPGYSAPVLLEKMSVLKEESTFRFEIESDELKNMLDVALLSDGAQVSDKTKKYAALQLTKDGKFTVSGVTGKNVTHTQLTAHEGALETIYLQVDGFKKMVDHTYCKKVRISGSSNMSPVFVTGDVAEMWSAMVPCSPETFSA